jgi:ABC-type xylose transport system permease subunit
VPCWLFASRFAVPGCTVYDEVCALYDCMYEAYLQVITFLVGNIVSPYPITTFVLYSCTERYTLHLHLVALLCYVCFCFVRPAMHKNHHHPQSETQVLKIIEVIVIVSHVVYYTYVLFSYVLL